jgi:hypothetical protein
MVMAAGAWFAAATALVLLVTPDANLVVRLAIFSLLNGLGAVGLVALAMRARATGTAEQPVTMESSRSGNVHRTA